MRITTTRLMRACSHESMCTHMLRVYMCICMRRVIVRARTHADTHRKVSSRSVQAQSSVSSPSNSRTNALPVSGSEVLCASISRATWCVRAGCVRACVHASACHLVCACGLCESVCACEFASGWVRGASVPPLCTVDPESFIYVCVYMYISIYIHMYTYRYM